MVDSPTKWKGQGSGNTFQMCNRNWSVIEWRGCSGWKQRQWRRRRKMKKCGKKQANGNCIDTKSNRLGSQYGKCVHFTAENFAEKLPEAIHHKYKPMHRLHRKESVVQNVSETTSESAENNLHSLISMQSPVCLYRTSADSLHPFYTMQIIQNASAAHTHKHTFTRHHVRNVVLICFVNGVHCTCCCCCCSCSWIWHLCCAVAFSQNELMIVDISAKTLIFSPRSSSGKRVRCASFCIVNVDAALDLLPLLLTLHSWLLWVQTFYTSASYHGPPSYRVQRERISGKSEIAWTVVAALILCVASNVEH